jgi:PKD repeat protein
MRRGLLRGVIGFLLLLIAMVACVRQSPTATFTTLNIKTDQGVSILKGQVRYDATALTLLGVNSLAPSAIAEASVAEDGIINFGLVSNGVVQGEVLELVFSSTREGAAASLVSLSAVSEDDLETEASLATEGTFREDGLKTNPLVIAESTELIAAAVTSPPGLKAEFANYPLGDFNSNAKVTLLDALRLTIALLTRAQLTDYQLYHSDISGNGTINFEDIKGIIVKAVNPNLAAAIRVAPKELTLDAGVTGLVLIGNAGNKALPAITTSNNPETLPVTIADTTPQNTFGKVYELTATGNGNGTVTFEGKGVGKGEVSVSALANDNTVTLQGRLILPPEVSIKPTDLQISSIVDDATFSPDGSYSIQSLGSFHRIFVTNQSEEIVLMGLFATGEREFNFSAEGSVLAFILSLPWTSSLNPDEIPLAMSQLRAAPGFQSLVLMASQNLINYKTTFPENDEALVKEIDLFFQNFLTTSSNQSLFVSPSFVEFVDAIELSSNSPTNQSITFTNNSPVGYYTRIIGFDNAFDGPYLPPITLANYTLQGLIELLGKFANNTVSQEDISRLGGGQRTTVSFTFPPNTNGDYSVLAIKASATEYFSSDANARAAAREYVRTVTIATLKSIFGQIDLKNRCYDELLQKAVSEPIDFLLDSFSGDISTARLMEAINNAFIIPLVQIPEKCNNFKIKYLSQYTKFLKLADPISRATNLANQLLVTFAPQVYNEVQRWELKVGVVPPVATLTASATTIKQGESINFDATASTPAESITSYEFTFGDGTTATDEDGIIEHTYTEPGTYQATVVVSDTAGQISEPSAPVVIQVTRKDNNSDCQNGNNPDCGNGSSNGDPHYRTLDGLYYDFQGVGEFILVKSLDDEFEIQTRQAPWGDRTDVSLNSGVAVRIGTDRLAIYIDQGSILYINGTAVNLSNATRQLSNGGSITESGGRYIITWKDTSQLRVSFRGPFLELSLSLRPERQRRIIGLLGNYDGNRDNDLSTRDGTVLITKPSFEELYQVYGNSWRIKQEESLFDYFGEASELKTLYYTDLNFPRTVATVPADKRAEAERICRAAGVTDPILLEACILDVALTGDSRFADGYGDVTPPDEVVAVPTAPPVISITSPANNARVGSNVLVRGTLSLQKSLRSLAYSLNDGATKDITAFLVNGTFAFTIPGQDFTEGANRIRMIAEDTDGTRGFFLLNLTYDPNINPIAGGDLVVFNDINIFDNARIGRNDNRQLVRNLVTFSGSGGIRDGSRGVAFDRGRNSVCGSSECSDRNLSTMRSVIGEEGYSIVELRSSQGTLTNIPQNIRVIVLWLPLVEYTVAEINTLKQFASEGGRIIFMGEREPYYNGSGRGGFAIQNQFLKSMGADLTNIGGDINCGDTSLPATSIRTNQITTNVSRITVNCSSSIQLGPNDYALFYDTTNNFVLAGVAAIDVTPISQMSPLTSTSNITAPTPDLPNPEPPTSYQ